MIHERVIYISKHNPNAQIRPVDIHSINDIIQRGNTAEIRANRDEIVIYEVKRKVNKSVAMSNGTR